MITQISNHNVCLWPMKEGRLATNIGRYSRISLVGELSLDRIRCSRICVVGAGALGNEVLKNLVLYGPKKLTLVDSDIVQRSNLGRCFLFTSGDAEEGIKKVKAAARTLRVMNDEVDLEEVDMDARELDDEFYARFDAVAGCVDNISSRLHVNSNCYFRNVPYVDGGLDGLLGRVHVVIPPDGPCYQCSVNATHMAVMDRDFTCSGREANTPRRRVPSEPSVSSIVGSMQSLEIVKLLSGKADGGKMYIYNGADNVVESMEVEIGDNCDNHGGA